MAKSMRSKTKRAFRAKKREVGVYAATHAARIQRLHAKIDAIIAAPKPVHDKDVETAEEAQGEDMAGWCQSRSPPLVNSQRFYISQTIRNPKPAVNLVAPIRRCCGAKTSASRYHGRR
jgi:hypothetical protein